MMIPMHETGQRGSQLFLKIVTGLIFVQVAFALDCFAQTVSSTDLITKAKAFDGKAVVYQGEVIGDVMARDAYAWVNIHDGKNAIGVWVKKELAAAIKKTGGYQTKGDTVEIVGTFHRSCAEHGGDLDIHAELARIVQTGTVLPEEPHGDKAKVALGLGIIVGVVWIVSRLNRPSR